MGLRASLQALVNKTILTGIGDLNATATFKSVAQTNYDTLTGIVTETVTPYTVTCVLVGLKQEDVTTDYADHFRNMDSITKTGRKVLVPSAQLPSVNVDALDDEVVVDGLSYNILTATLDPSGSLYIFIIKSLGGGTLGVG